MIQLVTVASVRAVYEKPAITVDISNDAQTDIWAGRFAVSRDVLLEAVQAVGPSVAALRAYFVK